MAMDQGGTGSILMDADAFHSRRERIIPDSNVVMHLPDALRNYRCGATLEGGVKCNDNMRNFVCYLDDDPGDSEGTDAANSVQCRDNKFRTKPEW